MQHKAAFVSIIGKPNVGKSTLMNALIDQKLSVTNPKAQTTRHRIRGIYSTEDAQLVFSDTPGILDPAYKLQETMMSFVKDSLEDADIVLFMIEMGMKVDDEMAEMINEIQLPLFIVLNKIDGAEEADVLMTIDHLSKTFPKCEIIPVSALKKRNVKHLIQVLIKAAPAHPAYFDKEALSDKNDRFFISEIIREKILTFYKKEVPYAVEVVIENYEETETMDRIEAVVYVERDSQKVIIVGKAGAGIKKLGTQSRYEIERYLGNKKVFLDLRVKVRKNWRSDDLWLKRFGYKSN
jgi:GTP-binding protein Era